MPQIYMVEDDRSIRELIGYALKTAGFEAVGFESGKEFFKALEDNKKADKSADLPALVLLDIMLPDENGLDILKKLRQRGNEASEIPVMMLTAKGSEIDKVSALDAGADDYMTKPFGVMELLSRVKALLRRSRAAGVCAVEDTFSLGGIKVDIPRHLVWADGEEITLTYKEFELLCYLLRNKGVVLTRDKIMQAVWEFDFEGESRTVDMHIKLLRKKLSGCAEQIKTVRGVGYKID